MAQNTSLLNETSIITSARIWTSEKGVKKVIIEHVNRRGVKVTTWTENPTFVNHDNLSALEGAKLMTTIDFLT